MEDRIRPQRVVIDHLTPKNIQDASTILRVPHSPSHSVHIKLGSDTSRCPLCSDSVEPNILDIATSDPDIPNLFILVETTFKNIVSAVTLMLLHHDGEEELLEWAHQSQSMFISLKERKRYHLLTDTLQNQDYPGAIPSTQSRDLLGRELDPEEQLIRGTLVTGLTDKDMEKLDCFEGEVAR